MSTDVGQRFSRIFLGGQVPDSSGGGKGKDHTGGNERQESGIEDGAFLFRFVAGHPPCEQQSQQRRESGQKNRQKAQMHAGGEGCKQQQPHFRQPELRALRNVTQKKEQQQPQEQFSQ